MHMRRKDLREFLTRIRLLAESVLLDLENSEALTSLAGERLGPKSVSTLDTILEEIDDYTKRLPTIVRSARDAATDPMGE